MQVRNNPKVMVIKDVIKELSKVQKDQGTLVHEIISENCFTFFSEAMKIARDRDLLGTIHISYYVSIFLGLLDPHQHMP